MKINQSFDQAVFVCVILALQKEHGPVKSSVMSQILDVSDSYLKKILMKLSKAGLVNSSANRHGGYQLVRPADEISLKDVFFALDLDRDVYQPTNHARQIFSNQKHVEQSENLLIKTVNDSLNLFYDHLDSLKIVDLLENGKWQNGVIDWEKRV